MATLWPNLQLCLLKSGHYENFCLLWIWKGLCVDRTAAPQQSIRASDCSVSHLFLVRMFLFFLWTDSVRVGSHISCPVPLFITWQGKLKSNYCNCLQRWKSLNQCVFSHLQDCVWPSVTFQEKKLWDIFILMLLFKYEKRLKQLLTTDVFIDLLFDLFDQAKMSNCDDFLLFSV